MTGRNISRELNKSQWSVPNEVGAASIPQGLSLVFGETSHNLPAERVQLLKANGNTEKSNMKMGQNVDPR